LDPQGRATLVASLLGTAQTPAKEYKKAAARLKSICSDLSTIAGTGIGELA
jgi:hypothetical protein